MGPSFSPTLHKNQRVWRRTRKPWLKDKATGEPVLRLPEKAAQMLNADLRRARARWIKEAPGKAQRWLHAKSDFVKTVDPENRVRDFHALRYTYITRLVNSGVSVKVCQDLARHSTPTLTIGRYAHTKLHDLTSALNSLPGTGTSGRKVATLQAAGTDHSRPFSAENVHKDPQQNPQQSECFSQLLGASECDEKRERHSLSRGVQPVDDTRVSDRMPGRAKPCATVAQLVEQRFCKPQVVGSNPTGGCVTLRGTTSHCVANHRNRNGLRLPRSRWRTASRVAHRRTGKL